MRMLLLAAATLALHTGAADAQSYGLPTTVIRADLPAPRHARPAPRKRTAVQPRQVSGWCHARAARLRQFDGRVIEAGRVSEGEARIASSLRADLSRACGRWATDRAWYTSR